MPAETTSIKFATFSERLAKVNIDVIHRIDRTGSYAEEVETYFYEALIKWKDLNLTEHFMMFFREVSSKSQSFNMLVFHQNVIVESLKTHLAVKNNMAYQPLLDLVIQLARDLQMDFYPHFSDFFIIITSILDTQDPEVLEWAFTCLSYMYKYLWRLMVKDMDKIYSLYSELLAHKKDHIRNFAAESFSFLMRKVTDYDVLFTLVFSNLSEHPQKAKGAGQLIFEMCRGVRGMFHSCASTALPVALKKLGPAVGQDVDLPWDSIKEALDHMAESSANYVDKEHLMVLWDSLNGSLKEVLGKLETSDADQANEHLERILYIYHTLVEHRKGAKITKPQSVCETLLKLVQAPGLSYSCSRMLLQVVSSLLMGENLSLPAQSIHELVKKVFHSGMDRDVILSFTKEMFDMKQFEQVFLPSLLQYLEQLFCTEDAVNRQLVLELLVGLILSKAPPPTDGSMAFEKYPLVFTGQTVRSTGPERDQSVSVPQRILSLIDIPINQPLSDLSHPWAALVLLPHVRPLEASSVIQAVTVLLNRLLQEVCSDTLGRGGLFVARQALSTLLSFKETTAVQSLLPVELVRNIIEKVPTDLSALLLGDLYYTRLALNGSSAQLAHDSLLELYHKLHSNFSSNISKIRLLTLRILSNFEADLPKPAEGEESSNAQTVFAVCLQAEQVPATVQDYREKLLHLRKLRHDLVQPCLPKGPFHEIPLRYLIAMLFVNFRPLWDAVIDLLVSHAKEMDNKSFWKVYHEHLEMVAGLAEEELQADDDDDDDEGGGEQHQAAKQLRGPGTSVIESGDVGVLFLEELDQVLNPIERTDFTNFRGLLWRAMSQFPERVEPRSRELSPLLLRFISNEFYPSDLMVAPTQDLMKKSSSLSEQEMGGVVDAEMEDDEEKEEDSPKFRKKMPRRAAAKQLIAHLKVFSKFTNPKSLCMEANLSELYTQLLCHKDQEIQKIALDCLMTYKDPNVLPYKENLERLLDDKHFKDEIVHFNISEEGTVVLSSHRPKLIPMLMRILYGKMCTKVGSKFQGKSGTASRSSIVLRFLAACQPEEMGMFIDLLLEPVRHYADGACLAAVNRAIGETNLSAVLPVGRQHSLLNTIELLINKLGHLIQIYLPKVLQILLCITASVSFILDHREQLKPGCINPLKNLRRLGILRIQDFFDGFECYNFTADELDAVFQAVVWPQVCRLPTESTYAPTPLMKVIRVWTQNARFFPLLAKQRPGHPECDVLLNVFGLLSSKNVTALTVAMVIDIAESLLSTPDFEPKENETELIVNDCVIPESCDVSDSLTVGCRLLLPHIPALLQYLSGVVRNSERLKKKKFRVQVSKELNILSKISRFVTEKGQSSTLIGLLLPYLHKPKTAQETELDILGTVQNLLRQCLEPSVFLKPLSKLFSIIHNRLSRQALCEAFQTLSDMDSELKYITDIVIQLNAFDSRHLDEVHFDVRLVAFQEATKHIKEMSTLDMRYLTAVMHNCFHSLEIGDMSLADSATMCLSAIIMQLSEVGCPEAEYKEIVQYMILDALRKGLKSKTESVRNEYTTILACLVKTFPNRPEFRDLAQLTDHNDPESDFFEHMKHIQVYRRGRALRKFARQLTEGKIVMSSRSMQNYIMPYAMIAIVDEKLLKYEPMKTAAIEVIGAVCRRLTWSKYLFYIKHFVHILQSGIAEQKLAVSLLLIVLDAFHFDHETLSKEMEAAKNRKTEEPIVVVEEAEDEAVETMDTDESDAEGAMETDEAGAAVSTALDTETEGPAKPNKDKESQTKKVLPVVSSGLPQSNHDLEALISSIHHTVTQTVLPKLHKCLTAKVKRDDEHKMVKSKEVKDEEVARVPIAFAMIQLMKSLPKDVMEANLPGILLKVCVHLRSRFQEIRDVARNTLVKIIETLGHQYLHYLLNEMQAVLVKGYQVHVLTFTVYYLLSVLKPSLNAGDLDPCMDMLITIFNNELFGAVAEEKDIRGIVSKVMEARHSKSSDSYELLGQFCSQERVVHLILPLKEVLENTASLKVSRRVHAVFRRIVAGLLLNKSLSPQSILLLCHGLISQSLPLITSKNKEKHRPPPDPRLPPPSCLLLPATPKRVGVKAAISSRTNMHILVETGLSLLHCSLKSSKINSSGPSVKEMLDPFVSLLLDCLNSMHVKVITEALQAFIWILKFPLPAVEQNYDQLTKQLFVLLKDYAKAGAARGENFPLVQNCFKAITVLVKSVTKHITETQLQVLLGYAEEDIYDHSRQATAFGLLRAILSRKLVVPEMEDVMKKLAKFAIDGSNEQVRMRCRQIYLKYLMDYPLGKKLRKHFDFIVAQLTYEYDTGRQSALELMAYIFLKFPQDLLQEHCGLFFVPLSLAMLNDDSASCKKMAALAIKSLLNQLDLQRQNSMFNLVDSWITDERPALRRLGAQVCGLFVEVEGAKFSRRLDNLIPLIEKEIRTSNFEDIEEEEDEKAADRLLFGYLTLIVKLIKDCSFLELHKPADLLNSIWGHIDSHLRYPHSWVWLTASQIFGLLFAAHKPEDLLALWSSQENKTIHPVATVFITDNLYHKMRELVLSFCYQLQSKFLDISAGEQVVKNLLYVAKVIYLISPESDTVNPTEEQEEVEDAEDKTTIKTEENEGEGEEENEVEGEEEEMTDKTEGNEGEEEDKEQKDKPPSLLWVMNKLSLLAKREAADTPKEPLKRTCVFKFLGAIAVDLGKDRLGPYLTTIIAPLYRELDSTYADQDPTLKNLAQELIDLLKKMVGLQQFSLAFAAVQKEAAQRRASRKKVKAVQAVVNPDLAARKKVKKQLKKNEAKKRKMEFVRTGHKAKKHKSSSLRSLAMLS
ncbi:hypothetical protein PO909_028779 [Leuciscus waleckii]